MGQALRFSPRIAVTFLGLGNWLSAAEPLPIALRQLVPQADTLDEQEAHRVRGSALSFSQGVITQFSTTRKIGNATVTLSGVVGGQQVTLAADANGFQFATVGQGIVTGTPAIQGVIAVQTGVFDSTLPFQGRPSSLTVIALPGQFGAAWR